MVAANSVQARLENSRVIPRIIPSSASVNGRPQNARPSPIVTGIASDLLHAGSHAYVTGIFRESPENSSPRTSRMYKLQGQAGGLSYLENGGFVQQAAGGETVQAPEAGIHPIPAARPDQVGPDAARSGGKHHPPAPQSPAQKNT